MNVLILDYGSGNVRSLYNTLKYVLSEISFHYGLRVSNSIDDLNKSDFIILPGVGSFKNCKNSLYQNPNLIECLFKNILVKKKPFLGICVGMQLLAEFGLENGQTSGLGFIKGTVKKIPNNTKKSIEKLKIPHIGWNNIEWGKKHKLVKGINKFDQFYFVHSYFFEVSNEENILAYTSYGVRFPSIINNKNIFGFQFHPEKSSNSGQKVLINWLNYN